VDFVKLAAEFVEAALDVSATVLREFLHASS